MYSVVAASDYGAAVIVGCVKRSVTHQWNVAMVCFAPLHTPLTLRFMLERRSGRMAFTREVLQNGLGGFAAAEHGAVDGGGFAVVAALIQAGGNL